jgi:hypothetical protein
MKILNSIDLYSDLPKINYNGRNKIKTKFGGILSVFTIILVIIATWLIGRDLIYKKEPTSYQQVKTSNKFSPINITSNNFPFGVSLSDEYGNLLNDMSYLNISLFLNKVTIKDDGSIEKISLSLDKRNCIKEDFPQINTSIFEGSVVQNYTCIDYKKIQNLELSGYWSESLVSYIGIYVHKCDYETFPEYCKSEKEIDDYISSKMVNFGFLSLDYDVDVSEFENPLYNFITLPYFFLTNELKVLDVMIDTNYVFTDRGYIFSHPNSLSYNRATIRNSDTGLYDKNSKKLLEANLYSSNKVTSTFRKYIKIPEIAASIGGIWKFITLVFSILNFPIKNLLLKIDLIESLFDLSEINSPNINADNSKNFSSIKFITLKPNNEILRNQESFISNSEIILQKYTKLSNRNITFNFSFCETLQIIAKRQNKNKNIKIKLFDDGEKKLMKYLDILFITKKIINLEYFENIILSKNQRELLTLIKTSTTDTPITDDKENDEGKIKDLIMNFNPSTEIDYKIMKLLLN